MSTQSNLSAHPIEVRADIQLAARTRVPVLITAPPDSALEVARAIADTSPGKEDLRVCDSMIPEVAAGGILLFREVQTLTARAQISLMALIAAQQNRPSEKGARIIASASVNLFDQVAKGKFDARLYYWLNAIHITIPTPRLERREEEVWPIQGAAH